MYYVEKVINNTLLYQTKPHGAWFKHPSIVATGLKPCPLCGNAAEFVAIPRSSYAHKVQCTNQSCGCTSGGSAFENDEYNINKWNGRV